ncbi:MAG: aldo/keto reductase [Hyphomicrobiales bacterium]|nr:aldo/keto reductase [Hyphomicrobiales bacterium]
MQFAPLGRTDIRVSRLCLGTMTFGHQNTEAEAHALLDAAFDAGLNCFDAAEMYPFPSAAESFGFTESHIGTWLARPGNRARAVVATKATGPGPRFEHIRGGDLRFGARQLRAAVEGSLRRLRTDYIDLYQLHWPDRNTNRFGQLGYVHNPAADADMTPLEETLAALDGLVRDGLVRAVGLSNENPWGLMRFLALADQGVGPRPVTVQNPYSLLNRTFEVGMAEVSLREECGLLAYSPLGFGTLTGKYLDGPPAPGTRIHRYPHFQRYLKPAAVAATRDYVALARDHGLDPAQMAIAYALSRPFMTSVIIGATNLDQLANNIAAADLVLSDQVVAGIEAIHDGNSNPAP